MATFLTEVIKDKTVQKHRQTPAIAAEKEEVCINNAEKAIFKKARNKLLNSFGLDEFDL